MPTRSDITVINSAYDTSGNGGRKLIRLSSGNQYAVVKNGTTDFRIYKSTDNWATQGTLFFTGVVANTTDVALATNGTYIFVLFTVNTTGQVGTRVLNESATILSSTTIDTGQTAVGNCSVEYNSISNAWETTWSSKNGTYPNSFNIRYAKGTVNADGSVTWGTVEQRTVVNISGSDHKNPTIVVNKNGYPVIMNDYYNGSSYFIVSHYYNGSTWTTTNIIYSGTTYAQSSPSAIFVPQSINGLANGRIEVWWSGRDATDNAVDNVRSAYSDDGGVTWTVRTKTTSGNTDSHDKVSVTASKNGDIHAVWKCTVTSTGLYGIRKIKQSGGSFGAVQTVLNGKNGEVAPSSLFDLSLNFAEPLFIYRDSTNGKVGFYGTWTVTTISVTPGAIGTKTSADKSNFLTYTITTDGTMSTITEKVNGAVVGTKTATSGQSLIAGLTQAQWDAIKYGKYADATGGLNTITVEMGSDVWTYTFDKRLATNEDIAQAVKATQDTQTTYLPSVKTKLASAITSKGGTASGSDSFDTLVSAIGGLSGVKVVSGTATSGNSSTGFLDHVSSTLNLMTLTVTGLNFKPNTIYIFKTGSSINSTSATFYKDGASFNTDINISTMVSVNTTNVYYVKSAAALSVTSTGFTMPVFHSNAVYSWIAIG